MRFFLLHTNQEIYCVFQRHPRSHFFSDLIFVTSTSIKNSTSSHTCSISTFICHQSIKFDISSFPSQMFFNRLPNFFQFSSFIHSFSGLFSFQMLLDGLKYYYWYSLLFSPNGTRAFNTYIGFNVTECVWWCER